MNTRALPVLAIVFFLSFVGRISVIAADQTYSSGAGEPASGQTSQCIDAAIADEVKQRIIALDERETDLAERDSALKVYELQIEKRLKELADANGVFAARVSAMQTERDADIVRLAAIYEGMKPAQASEIIAEMDPKFAAGLLAAMRSEQAAQIVATMEPEKAYMVSVIMANRSHTE